MKQSQFDAFVSFVYNCGHGNFSSSHMLSYFNNGSPMLSAGEFPKWNHVNGVQDAGVLKRRLAEQQLFVNGDYSGRP
jgi:lysozyme